MASAILTLSKRPNEADQYADGVRAGEQWAQAAAEYEQLFRVLDLTHFDQDNFDGALSALCDAVDPDGYGGSPNIIEDLFGHERDVSDAEAAGFITGARQYFKDPI